MTENILSIDWDYITGDCSSITHSHCGFCNDKKYVTCIRGFSEKSYFDTDGFSLIDDLLKIIHNGIKLYVAESHADILKICSSDVRIFDFDSHFDNYDSKSFVHCGNWIYHIRKEGGTVLRRGVLKHKINKAFICKSSPWTPSCFDDVFYNFIDMCSKKANILPVFIGHRKKKMEEEFENFYMCGMQEQI